MSRAGLMARYLEKARKHRTKSLFTPEPVPPRFHGQLFRNVVFASEMADKDWHVVNLVGRRQHQNRRESARCSFIDPTEDVRSFLRTESHSCFAYRTWEGLHDSLVKTGAALAQINRYMRNMSAHYLPAFALS